MIIKYNYDHAFDNYIYKKIPKLDTIIFDNYMNSIYYGSIFNQPMDNLPNTIANLTLGSSFNKSIDNLPNSITNLILDEKFN